MDLSIMIVGVGGQGTLLASRVLGKYAYLLGLDCKLSEVHGMAQRGGSVVTHVKIGKKVYSPLVEEGFADVVLSFEQLETLRWANYIKKDGKIIYNSQEIMPMPVITGSTQYPNDIFDKLKKFTNTPICVDAMDIAKKCGNIKTVNTVMLAILCKTLNLDRQVFQKALEDSVPKKALEINVQAFNMGYSLNY